METNISTGSCCSCSPGPQGQPCSCPAGETGTAEIHTADSTITFANRLDHFLAR